MIVPLTLPRRYNLTATVGDLASPNQAGGFTSNVTWNAPTTSTGLVYGMYSFVGVQSTVSPTGHAVGVLGQIQVNAPASTVDLAIGIEGKHTHVTGTITSAVGALGVLTSNAATITNWTGVGSQVTANSGGTITNCYMFGCVLATNASGTISNLYGYYFPDMSGITNVPATRFCFYSADASAPAQIAGEIRLGTGTADTGIQRVAVSTAQITNAAGSVGYLNMAGKKYTSAQFDKTDTNLASITGLLPTLVAGRAYHFKATLFVTAAAAGGHKYDISGTATATAVHYSILAIDNTAKSIKIATDATALATSGTEAPTSGTSYIVTIEGNILVNAGGTLGPRFAQNTASGTSSVLVGSSFIVEDIT